jgi:SAM-dependent methyltransferase
MIRPRRADASANDTSALASHREAWEALGRVDPLWAVLTEPGKRGRRWAWPEFLATGTSEVDALLEVADGLGLPRARRSALDVGCGVGRLTLPLAGRFERVTGVDISRAMVEAARDVAREQPNVTFEVLGRDGSIPLPESSFDLVLSAYVLQHLPSPTLVTRSLVELRRFVHPEGLLVVQLPGPIPLRHRLQPRRRAYAALRGLGVPERVLFDRLGLSPMRLVGLSQADVREVLEHSGLTVRAVRADLLSRSRMDSFTYYATPKPTTPSRGSTFVRFAE